MTRTLTSTRNTGKCAPINSCTFSCASGEKSRLFAIISSFLGLKIEAGTVLDLHASTCISVEQCNSDCNKQVTTASFGNLGSVKVCSTKTCGSGKSLVSTQLSRHRRAR